MENNNEEKVISIGDLFKYLWKNIILFIAVLVGVFAVGLVYSFAFIKPEYKSSATFVTSVKQGSGSSSENVDYVNSFRIIQTVASLVTEDIVVNPVAEKYGISKSSLSKMIMVNYEEMNFLISVDVQCQDNVLSKNVANSLVEQLIEVTHTVPGLEFLDGTVTQTSFAEEGVYASPNKVMCVLISFVAGAVVACGVVAVKELLSTKFRNRKEIESRLSARVLGYFPVDKELIEYDKKHKGRFAKAKLVEFNVKNFESYNSLLGNIKYSDLENPNKVIMVTSSIANEMKSSIACNLAACAAYNGQKVVIVDLDMRKPVVHKVFNVSGEIGLVEYIGGECNQNEVIKHTECGVDVITVGKRILNPMAIIGNKKLQQLLTDLKNEYDLVIVDTAPVLACSDSLSIAPLCDGVLLIVAMADVRKKEAEESMARLRNSGAKIIGVNVTKGNESKVDGGYYGNEYYYKEYASITHEDAEKND